MKIIKSREERQYRKYHETVIFIKSSC